jgi:NAD+ dependent glucose-6-phosphate dehydrogenase
VTTETRKRVLVTGAEGQIGGAMREYLPERYDVRFMTRSPKDFESVIGDVSDLESILPAFEGIDVVVHLAGKSSIGATWDELLPNNFVGTYNVYEAARRSGVGAVVYASSNHAVGMYEVDGSPEIFELDNTSSIDHTVELRPDSLYGVSKIYGEAIARYYLERHGIRSFCLRIGACRDDDDPVSERVLNNNPIHLDLKTPEERRKRMRAGWLSRRDCAQLVSRCIDADHVRWALVYGISNNPRQFWDISHARELLGYDPQDSAPV